MYEDILSDLGLTRSEIAVYFALLEIGSSTTGPVIKKAGIASGKAYIILDRLVSKGLVTYFTVSGRKQYQAKDPDRLLDLLKLKEGELKQKEDALVRVIPALKAMYEEKKYKPVAEVFEGVGGFKTFYEGVLKELNKGETMNVLGVSKEALDRFNVFFLEWNKRRIGLGIRARIIFNSDCRGFGKLRERMPFTEVRYMKKELETPVWIDVFKDNVCSINVIGAPLCFLVRNKETAESYKKYFDMIWEQSER